MSQRSALVLLMLPGLLLSTAVVFYLLRKQVGLRSSAGNILVMGTTAFAVFFASAELDNLCAGQILGKSGVLRQIADLPEGRSIADRLAEHPAAAFRRADDGQQRLDHRAFARPVRTQ